jgi:hypothetical protein
MKLKGIYESEIFDVGCALVVAPTAKFKYKDSYRKVLKKQPTKTLTKEQIRDTLHIMGYDLVVFGGLEWGDSTEDLVEIIETLKDSELKLIFQTGYSVDEFQERVGRASFDRLQLTPENLEKLTSEDDPEVYKFVGHTMLDYLVGGDYIIMETSHKNRDGEAVYLYKGVTDESDKN